MKQKSKYLINNNQVIEFNRKPKVLLIGNGVFYKKEYEWNRIVAKYSDINKDLEGVPNSILTLFADYSKKSHKERLNEAFKNYNYEII